MPTSKRMVIDLCSGSCSVSIAAACMGFNSVSIDFDPVQLHAGSIYLQSLNNSKFHQQMNIAPVVPDIADYLNQKIAKAKKKPGNVDAKSNKTTGQEDNNSNDQNNIYSPELPIFQPFTLPPQQRDFLIPTNNLMYPQLSNYLPPTPEIHAATPPLQAATPAVQAATPAVQAATLEIQAPAAQATTPALQVATPAVQAATLEIQAPAVQATTPALQAATPAVQATTPAVQAATPAVQAATLEIQAPSVQAATPAVQAATLEIQATTPVVQAATPAVQAATTLAVKPAGNLNCTYCEKSTRFVKHCCANGDQTLCTNNIICLIKHWTEVEHGKSE